MRQAAAQAQVAFAGAWADCDGDPLTGVEGRERVHCGPGEVGAIYPIGGPDSPLPSTVPCRFPCSVFANWRSRPLCRVIVPPDGCVWIDGDCDTLTGIEGNECLVSWFHQEPPPPPHMLLVTRELGRGPVRQSQPAVNDRSRRAGFRVVPHLARRRLDATFGFRPRHRSGPQPLAAYIRVRPAGRRIVSRPGLAESCTALDFGPIGRVLPRVGPCTPEPCRRRSARLYAGQIDTALALSRASATTVAVEPCSSRSRATRIRPWTRGGLRAHPHRSAEVSRRCDERGRCRATTAPPRTAGPTSTAFTTTDRGLGRSWHAGSDRAGVAGDPQTNFAFIVTTQRSVAGVGVHNADARFTSCPTPRQRSTMAPWTLHPNNEDPNGSRSSSTTCPRRWARSPSSRLLETWG